MLGKTGRELALWYMMSDGLPAAAPVRSCSQNIPYYDSRCSMGGGLSDGQCSCAALQFKDFIFVEFITGVLEHRETVIQLGKALKKTCEKEVDPPPPFRSGKCENFSTSCHRTKNNFLYKMAK